MYQKIFFFILERHMRFQLRCRGWLAFILTIPVAQVFSQVHNSMQARSFSSPSLTIVYRLFVPENYDPARKYPLTVTMHGVGERGNDNTRQVDLEDLVSTWIADDVQKETPHFVMGPQCPGDLYWGGATTAMVHDIIDSLTREFSLDTNRLYAVGLSMGAAGVFSLLESRPGRFAAALACAGAGNNNAAADIARTPLWAFHAAGDGVVDVNGTRSMVEAIENTGITFVRFVSESWTNSPGLTTYSDAIRNGTDPLTMVAKNPDGISYDSLKRAVEGGADYLYSEVKGGDHRTGWMIAFHHPLVPQWLFSKTKEVPTEVVSFRQAYPVHSRKNTLLILPYFSGNSNRQFYTLQGRKISTANSISNNRYRVFPVIAVPPH
jgi:predicted peptidase